MLRRILLASAGALALSGGALAAELLRPPPPPVYIPPAPPPLWTGFYLGVNAGGTWNNTNNVDIVTTRAFFNPAVAGALSVANATALADSGIIPLQHGGFIGGGQLGYNYQFGAGFGAFVAGFEADIQGIAASNRSGSLFDIVSIAPPFLPTQTVHSVLFASKNLDFIGTVRGRLGYLITPTFLIYGTGGFAYGGTQSRTAIFSGVLPSSNTTNVAGFGTESTTRGGWTAGGGAEWMFLPNWSVKAEYLFYNLGTITYPDGPLSAFLRVPAGVPVFTDISETRLRFNGNIVRAGLNYHFTWPTPIVSKY